MSWQAYVDTSLIGTGKIDKAAIFNSEGTSVWASSAGFNVAPTEIKEIVGCYEDKSEPKKIQTNGFRIAGEKYMTFKAEDRSIYGRKGKEGAVIVKTKMAILVTHYPETVQHGEATTVVEQLADYLIGVNY